jgi:uncharacterized membrane protein (UPF0136 family)
VSPTVGYVALAIYAALLGAGGVMGYVKAQSRPSLVAGLATAGATLLALVVGLASKPGTGFLLGLLIAGVMTVFFLRRWLTAHKFMPSGLLAILSAVMTSLMAILLVG